MSGARGRLRAHLRGLSPGGSRQMPAGQSDHRELRCARAVHSSCRSAGPLTPAQLEQWEEDGYVVLKTEAPPELLGAARAEIWRLAQRDEHGRSTWHQRLPVGASRSGVRYPFEPSNDTVGNWRSQADLEVHMLGLWQTQAQWNIRQLPRIHAAFAQLWRTAKLWVSVDCVNLKPPVADAHPGWGGHTYLHWDWNLAAEGLGIQGALYLSDTAIDGGGFRMIPGFAARFNREASFREMVMAWRAAAADNAPGGCKDLSELTGMPVVTLPGHAGDLVIWNSLLPHGNARNSSGVPRQAMFLTYRPVDQHEDIEATRQQRITAWRERLAGEVGEVGDARENNAGAEPATLTPLGERLLGLSPW